MKKIVLKILIIFIILILFVVDISFAHPGRTDSNGGHYNRSTGEYHYHNDGSSTNSNESYYTIVNNDSELLEELQIKYDDLQEQIDKYENSLESYGYNSIDEMNQKIKDQHTQISNMWSGFFFATLFIIGISYNLGSKKQ